MTRPRIANALNALHQQYVGAICAIVHERSDRSPTTRFVHRWSRAVSIQSREKVLDEWRHVFAV